MEIKRVSIPLSIDEMNLLKRAAQNNCRRPQDHVRWLVLNSLNLLTESPAQTQSVPTLDTERLEANEMFTQ